MPGFLSRRPDGTAADQAKRRRDLVLGRVARVVDWSHEASRR
jgi:hypothetical protein